MILSIITINYNNSLGLSKTIKSVINQNFKDFEYIIIDGGSIDGSVEQIFELNNKINYWISEKDTGVYHAMNKGILQAKGEYLLFLNSGDFFLDNSILEQIFNRQHTADILCGRCAITKKGKIVHLTNPPESHTFLTYFQSGINHQSTFIKRVLFEKYGLYKEDFKYNADWEFWIRTIILNNCTTEKMNEIICEYNLEGISSMENHTERYKNEITEVFSNPLLQKFIPDYEFWQKEQKANEPLYWIKSKKILYKPLLLLYKLAFYYNKQKKSNMGLTQKY
jgi:glycosyltransferase involved in cell wall biosynthesis